MNITISDMTREDIDVFLKSQKVGCLCLADGTVPYGVPLAYSYDGRAIYLTMGPKGRKMACLNSNNKVCFVVWHMPEGAGMANMTWTSIICDGELEHLTDPEGLTLAVRTGEKHLGMPEGTWNGLLEKMLANPAMSAFWKLNVTAVGGKKC
jgi:nitroimidazol reductase NimA-like FMN-containing flavoprotein (pyridoxamine 5'-phosphate oxidase superfamily)